MYDARIEECFVKYPCGQGSLTKGILKEWCWQDVCRVLSAVVCASLDSSQNFHQTRFTSEGDQPTMAVAATVHNTLGVLYDSIVITSILYGVGCLQAWYYYQRHSKNDYLAIRLLVAFVLICDTVQQALLCVAVYEYAVTNHNDPLAMTRMEGTIMIELYFGGALAFAVQQFYCWRIFGLSRNYFVAGFVSALSIASLVLIYVYTSITLNYASLGELVQQSTLCTILNTFGAVTDIAITVCMIWYLQKSKTEFKRTKDLLNRLIVFTFNTGIPTSVCAIADVITLNTLSNTFIYMSFYLIMDRLYTNSLFVTLNARSFIRKSVGSSNTNSAYDHESFSLSQIRVRTGTAQVSRIEREEDIFDGP
ncbi:hypothetical protein BDZ89DRAFT_1077485 [Hymenopellis radicata]|nr:hypothetical protein BDZ89DRAFT_1077485 [Hymenopellis radicata]